MARGGAKPGDKTMVDALVPASEKAAEVGGGALDAALSAVAEAAAAGRDASCDMIATMGRAKTLGENSLGHPEFGRGHAHDLPSFDTYHEVRGLRWPVVDGKETRWRYREGFDPYVKPETVDGFVAEMEAAGVDYQLIMYAHAVHAFTQKAAGDDPARGAAYNAAADARSWRHLQDFFAEILR